MNRFVGIVALTVAALIQFEILQMREEEVTIKLFLLAVSGIFFVRAEVEDLHKHIHPEDEEDDKPKGRPRLRS